RSHGTSGTTWPRCPGGSADRAPWHDGKPPRPTDTSRPAGAPPPSGRWRSPSRVDWDGSASSDRRMRPVAMAFWDSSPRLLPIEFREAAVAAGEGFELGEDGECAREHVADGEGAVAGSDALETLDPRTPAFRARTAGLHGGQSCGPRRKGYPGSSSGSRSMYALFSRSDNCLRNFTTFGATTARQ